MEAIESKQYGKYTVNIYYDEDALNPRDEWNNVATFVCHHRRYDLGDRQDYESCIRELFDEYVPAEKVLEYFIKSRGAEWTYPDDEDDEVCDKYLEWKETYVGSVVDRCFGVNNDEPIEDIVYNNIIEELYPSEMLELVEDTGKVAILPISIYEHGGIHIWCGTTDGHPDARWDCGTIGFAYIEEKTAEKEGMLNPGEEYNNDWKQWAYEIMDKEMEVYDAYVNGEVYAFAIEEDGEEDGFTGSYYGYDGRKQLEVDADEEVYSLIQLDKNNK